MKKTILLGVVLAAVVKAAFGSTELTPSGGDDTYTVQTALNNAASSGGVVRLGPGKFRLSYQITVYMGQDVALSILGSGQDVTRLEWINGGGLSIIKNDSDSGDGLTIEGLSILTDVYSGSGISVTSNFLTGYVVPLTTIQDVTIKGGNPWSQWGVGIFFQNAPETNLYNVMIVGVHGQYTSNGVVYAGSPGQIATAHTVFGLSVVFANTAIYIQDNIEGVTITEANLTAVEHGVFVDSSGHPQFSMNNSQVTAFISCVVLRHATQSAIMGNSFFNMNPSGFGVRLADCHGISITGNCFWGHPEHFDVYSDPGCWDISIGSNTWGLGQHP